MKLLWLQLALAGAIGIAVALLAPRRSVAVPDAHWTNERLVQEMAELDYKSEWVNTGTYPTAWTQGLYLARRGDARSWQAIAARSDRGATFCFPYPRVVGTFLHDSLSVATSEALRAFHCACQLRKEDLNVAGGSLSGRAGAASWFDGMMPFYLSENEKDVEMLS